MTTYSNYVKIFFVCIFLNGCTECRNWVYPEIKYYFLQSVSLSPYQKSYRRLDTIKIEIDIPNKLLFDTLSKSQVQTDSISLPIHLLVTGLNIGQPPAQDGYFDFVDSIGQRLIVDTLYSYINHGVNFSSSINCSQNADYLFKVGM